MIRKDEYTQKAYDWALTQPFHSVAADYARKLALHIKRLESAFMELEARVQEAEAENSEITALKAERNEWRRIAEDYEQQNTYPGILDLFARFEKKPV